MATVLVNKHGKIAADPQVTLLGLEDGDALLDLQDDLSQAVREAVDRLPTLSRRDDETVREARAAGHPPRDQGPPGKEADDPDPSDAAVVRSGIWDVGVVLRPISATGTPHAEPVEA